MNINSLIRCYLNLYFNNKFIIKKFKSAGGLSLDKIFVSKAEIKHTNSKAIITVYTYNKEKLFLLERIKSLKISSLKKIFLLIYKGNILQKNISNNLYNKTIKALLYKELILLRRFKLKLSLNKYKFEEKFLYKLSKLISKFYNKKIELNIVNLKSITLNSDLFTKLLALKLKNRKANAIRIMRIIVNKAALPEISKEKKKSNRTKNIDFSLIENKYKNLNLSSIIKDNNLDKLLNELYYSVILNKGYKRIYKIIYNSIKYKKM
jgi:hypothetical protein